MIRRLCLVLLASCFSLLQSRAQTALTWEQTLDLLGETEDIESVGWASQGALLGDLFVQKMDINTITKSELEQLPFLSAQQVEDICLFVYKYAPLQTLNELSMVESLDGQQRLLLQQFLRIDPPRPNQLPSLEQILKHGNNELMAYGYVPFFSRQGDRDGYEGYKYRHWLRYTFNYGDRVKAAVIGSQDAGEPFFSGKNSKGYDYYSFFLQLRKFGRLKSLVVGRYRARFGMGLVMNTNFTLGKLTTLSSLGRGTTQLTGHSSRMDGLYLQGAAATIALTKHLDITALGSWRKIDATLTADGQGIATLLTSGMHRTESELNRKHNASQWVTGGNIEWHNYGITLGLTGVYTGYDKPLQPNTAQEYRKYNPAGDRFWNVGLHYAYQHGPLALSGETATGDSHALATVNTLSYEFSSRLKLMALQRFYSYKFYSIYGQSYGDNTAAQNESGLYLGGEWKPLNGLTVMGYTDVAYFPRPRYLISDSSHSWDNLLQATYTRGAWTVLARYRLRKTERDNADKTDLLTKTDHRGRFSLTYQTHHWQAKTQADLSQSHLTDNSFGYMLSQQGAYRTARWQVGGTLAYFNTDNYDSRVYLFEPGMIYTMNFPMFYGEGIHYALHFKWTPTPRLLCQAKLSTANYFDRNHIASELQQINHSSQTELELQVRWRF